MSKTPISTNNNFDSRKCNHLILNEIDLKQVFFTKK